MVSRPFRVPQPHPGSRGYGGSYDTYEEATSPIWPQKCNVIAIEGAPRLRAPARGEMVDGHEAEIHTDMFTSSQNQ